MREFLSTNIFHNVMLETQGKYHWIFVFKDTYDIFENRINVKHWPITLNTPNRKKIGAQDKIIFYRAGEGNQKLLGTANAVSSIIPIEGKMDFIVSLDEISIWKKPISIKPLIKNLNFIKNKLLWGVYMQGGVIRVSQEDFELLSKQD
jgi:hypothetical protein